MSIVGVQPIRMKTCAKCELVKPVDDFCRRKKEADGLNYQCRTCGNAESIAYYYKKHEKSIATRRRYYHANKDVHRRHSLKRRYGLDLETYNTMFEEQRGCCAICSTHQSDFNYSLVVDHDHKTKEIRGLLCHHCNRGIGLLRDDPVILDRARAYLGRAMLKVVVRNSK